MRERSITMKNKIILILSIISINLSPSIADYTSEERNDHSKTTYGEVNAIYGSRENSHAERRRTYDNPPYNNIPGRYYNAPTNIYPSANSPCSLQTGCPVTQDAYQNRPPLNGPINAIDVDNSASSVAGQTNTPSGLGSESNGINNVGTQQQTHYQEPYPPTRGYFPPGQIDPGFARFPPPQQGGPMQNYYPSGQNNYPYFQQQPYGQLPPNGYSHHGSNRNHNQYQPQGIYHHQHQSGGHGHHTWDHTFKENTEYTETGHHRTGFQGTTNGLGYGNGFGYGGYLRHGY